MKKTKRPHRKLPSLNLPLTGVFNGITVLEPDPITVVEEPKKKAKRKYTKKKKA